VPIEVQAPYASAIFPFQSDFEKAISQPFIHRRVDDRLLAQADDIFSKSVTVLGCSGAILSQRPARYTPLK